MWKIRNWMRFLGDVMRDYATSRHPVHVAMCLVASCLLVCQAGNVRFMPEAGSRRYPLHSLSSHGCILHKLYKTFVHKLYNYCFIKQLFCIAQWFSKLCHVRPLSSVFLIPDLHSTALQAIYFITELALAADPADFEALYGISIPEPSLPGAPFRRRVSACLHVSGSCW